MVGRLGVWLLFAVIQGEITIAWPQSAANESPRISSITAAACSPLELIIARGTTETLNPAYGLVVGDPLFEAVHKLIPSATGYSVNYPASFETTSRDLGRDDVVKHLTEQSKACPEQKFVMVGYSQGGDVMHNALASPKLDQAIFEKIVALVMFGDPGNKGPAAKSPLNCDPEPPFPSALLPKLKENCEAGDPVCTNDGAKIEAHLVYSDPAKNYMTDSAVYIKKQFDSNGKAGAEPSPNVGTGDNTAALLELGQLLGGPKVPAGECGLQLQASKGAGGVGSPVKGPPSRERRGFAKALGV
ncbi:alpha/beta-hydrolase [Tothia fuscella]|uniref:Alpha/beta-hydrolase n=1 Tax=Tothia fuscella TaxID=1048955 RepID=A0A9P4NGD6_9PEZI|nr:alpha/beta-hydrolase [Tothia fuscella]